MHSLGFNGIGGTYGAITVAVEWESKKRPELRDSAGISTIIQCK